MYDAQLEARLARKLLNVFVRTGLILVLVINCYHIFAPFLNLMLWAVIMAINMFPLHQRLARRLGDRPGRAALLLVGLGLALVVAPTAVLMSSLGDSVSVFIEELRTDSLHIPPPPAQAEKWPVVGPLWSQAATDLPGLVQRFQPKAGELARSALAMVANLGGGILQLLAAFCVAGILVTQGSAAQARARGFAFKLAGPERGAHFANLCTATIRAVARGVIGVAFIQAIVVGICLMLAGVPAPGLLALVTLVLGIAQVPAALITLPAIGYVWMAGGHSPVVAALLTLLLFVGGMADNVLKPMLLGRGVDAPMPVVLLGALGGMAHSGILGLFVGSTMLTLGYQILMDWVEAPEDEAAAA